MGLLTLIDGAQWAKLFYVCSHRFYLEGHMRLARFVCYVGRLLTTVEIRPSARIGKHLSMPHPNGIVIGDMVRIGDSVVIMQQVTLGTAHIKRTYCHEDVPSIGDNVIIGAGAKILGGIHVGSYASIGANAVVLQSVPNNSIAVGVPARILPEKPHD